MKPLYPLLIALCILMLACSKETNRENTDKSVISKLAIKINDAIPANVIKIRISDLPQTTYIDKNITSSEIGLRGMEVELNCYRISESFNGELTVYYIDAKPVNRKISNVQLKRGNKTTLSGDFFINAGSVVVDDNWADTVIVDIDGFKWEYEQF